jgi:sugar phosphate isomerase/epimerase
MKIGVFTALWGNLSFDEALDKAVSFGITAVEIGAGGYPGQPHCPVDELLESESKRDEWLGKINDRGLKLSALSIHNNPIHPDKKIAEEADLVIKKAIQLAVLLKVPTINGFSGLPAGAAKDTMPNWVTCAWPPHFLDILDYQWNEVAIPYWKTIHPLLEDNDLTLGFEMHPGILVYNVDTLLRLRDAVGPRLGCNFDPSHLWWNGVDPVAAIRELGDAIFHVHGKDVYIDPYNTQVNGCNDYKHYGDIPKRSWTFRSIGYGHDLKAWKDIVSALKLVGYDYVVSIEHEDAMMSPDEGLGKAVNILKDALIFEEAGEMFWA